MSKTIDERVVEMRFDNSRFEKNVQQSMSTLDKLKQSLNLNGAAKGLDSINAASKKFDLSGMENGVGTLHAKFSALEVVGVTALANIANSAVNAGKRIIGALTIEPITTGFNEYETKIKDLEAASKAETLDGKYKVTVTPSDSEGFAKVYTLTQNSKTIGTINIPKDQFLDSVYYINSQEDATSKLPEGTALTPEELAELPALIFIWKVTDSKTYSVVSIKSILGTVTNEIDTKVNALDKKVTELVTDVETLKTSVKAIESSYITGAKINGQTVDVIDHVLQLSYNILYESGTLSEGISEGFLSSNGITLS